MVKISQPDTIEEVALTLVLLRLFILLNKKFRGVLQLFLTLHPRCELPLCVLKLLMKLLLFCLASFSLEHVLMCEIRSLKKKKKS
ncbi:hypothetical protein ACOSP7_019168 [Xanthoceras sorbifolium]